MKQVLADHNHTEKITVVIKQEVLNMHVNKHKIAVYKYFKREKQTLLFAMTKKLSRIQCILNHGESSVKPGQSQCLCLVYKLNDTVHITLECTKTGKAH